MKKRVVRIITAAVLALVFAWGLALGGTRPSVVYSADPTPTPTPAQTNSEPGGHGGGGGG
jgi:hypothetical protein